MQLALFWFCGMMYGGGYTLPLCKFTINLFIFNQVSPFRETIDTWVAFGGQCKRLYFVRKSRLGINPEILRVASIDANH